jgi:RNA polymerase sigma-70 factor (ECF subfamily)
MWTDFVVFSDMINAQHTEKHKAFEKEALPHADILYNYALRMTNDPADADDLVQETFLKAFRFWDKYEQGTNIRAWLFRILKNSYINRYRKVSKEPDTVDYDEVQNFYASIRDDSADPNDLQQSIFGNLLEDDVAGAIAELPEDFRTVVILSDIEGLTYEEIAEFVDCPVGTVRSRLHRGRKLLRARLFDYAKDHGYISSKTVKEVR